MSVMNVIAGWILFCAGVVMIPLPGPGFVPMLAGLAILQRHYSWARRAYAKVQAIVRRKGK